MTSLYGEGDQYFNDLSKTYGKLKTRLLRPVIRDGNIGGAHEMRDTLAVGAKVD